MSEKTVKERMAVIETKVDDIQDTLKKIDSKLDNIENIYVKKSEFSTLQKVVYSSIGVVITTVIGIVIAIL